MLKPGILLVVAISLFFAGCSSPINPGGNGTQPVIPTGNLNDRTFIYDIGPNPNGSLNKTVSIPANTPGFAYSVYGRTNLTVSDCLGLEGIAGKTDCLQQAAAYLNDSSVCDLAGPAYQPDCYMYYALKDTDASSCDKAATLFDTECRLSNDAAYCDEGSKSESTSCKRQIAALSGNPSMCTYDPADPAGSAKNDLCQYYAGSKKLSGNKECSDASVPYNLVETTNIGQSIRWLEDNHPGEKVLSWWDYGDSLDCAGLQSVISSKNLDDPTIGYVAHLLVSGNESELATFMRSTGAKYLMLDNGLIANVGSLGGKFGAIDYLSCVNDNGTTMNQTPGTSACEAKYYWETIYVSNARCSASVTQEGFGAYKIFLSSTLNSSDFIYSPTYPAVCINATDQSFCKSFVEAVPSYCVAMTQMADNSTQYAPYFENQSDKNGKFALDRALMFLPYNITNAYPFGNATALTLMYTHDKIWLVNGTATDGYADRTTAFYDSVLYKGIFLDQIDGFKDVYTDPSGTVKIFELEG